MSLLTTFRNRLGSAPRDRYRGFLLPPGPSWVEGDAMELLWGEAESILREGTPVVGRITMANTKLWEPGDHDGPGTVVYSFDPALAEEPRRLAPIAESLYRYHQAEMAAEPPRSPWARRVLDDLQDGLARTRHQRLPPEVAGGRVVYESTVMFFRDHLPDGHIAASTVPLLVQRKLHGWALVAPWQTWPEALVREWRRS